VKRALILGISGQDGSYLAQLLLSKGYEVHGTSRDADAQPFGGLVALGIRDRVTVHSASPLEFRNVLEVIATVKPQEIYNLAGQSSVGLSFLQPVRAMESIAVGALQLLEAVRFHDRTIRVYNASSSECFGEVPTGTACDERTPFRPRSPYATAKAAAHWATANYRDAYGLFACSGILFNHESPLRPRRFVTSKILSAARRVAAGEKIKMEIGNLRISRDWGYAPEYVQAMWLMLQRDEPEDFVIATGESHTLEEFLAGVFARHSLDWREHVVVDPRLFRPSDIAYNRGNPTRSREHLHWTPRTSFDQLLDVLVRDTHD
jgi:GDPmannose 4,6-dehydratase